MLGDVQLPDHSSALASPQELTDDFRGRTRRLGRQLIEKYGFGRLPRSTACEHERSSRALEILALGYLERFPLCETVHTST